MKVSHFASLRGISEQLGCLDAGHRKYAPAGSYVENACILAKVFALGRLDSTPSCAFKQAAANTAELDPQVLTRTSPV